MSEKKKKTKKRYKKCVQSYTKLNLYNFGEEYFNLIWQKEKCILELTIDHKFSISEGYKNDIPAIIISSPNNLRLISEKENNEKGKKCSITIIELFEGFLNFKKEHSDIIDKKDIGLQFIKNYIKKNYSLFNDDRKNEEKNNN